MGLIIDVDMDGYKLAEEIYGKILKDSCHEISYEDMVRAISFWGLNEEAPITTRIGFVCYCARLKLKKAIEQALVWGDYSMLYMFLQSTNFKSSYQ